MTELWHEQAGDGTPLLLVHAGICDARMWDSVWPALVARHLVIRYDLRGFGRSGRAVGRLAPYDDLVEVLDATGVERAAVCGVSYGGTVALDAALVHPDRVAALAIVSSVADWSAAPDALVARIEAADAAGEGGDVARAVELELDIWLEGEGRTEPVAAGVRERVRMMNRRAWELALTADVEQDRLEPPASDRLGEITQPALVVTGEHDVPFVRSAGAALAAALPRATHEVVAGAAHLPPLERPEAFAELLLGFLARTPHS